MSTRCKSCGEEILRNGNYEFKIMKAKRIPKKARKLMLQTEGSSREDNAALSQTKFGQFLLRRSHPRNSIEITCGNCSNSSQILMRKPSEAFSKSDLTTPSNETSFVQIDLTGTGSTRKKKKRKKKDLTAGLCIPSSLNSSKGVNDTPLKASSATSSPNSDQTSKFIAKPMKTKADKEKQMDNLRKVLFKSKKNTPTVGASLQDFLSSM